MINSSELYNNRICRKDIYFNICFGNLLIIIPSVINFKTSIELCIGRGDRGQMKSGAR